MQFVIQVKELSLVNELKTDVPPGVSIHAEMKPTTRSFGFDAAIPIFVNFIADVGIGILSAWLYDKLKKGKSKTVIVDRQEIEITPEAIATFIQAKRMLEKSDS